MYLYNVACFQSDGPGFETGAVPFFPDKFRMAAPKVIMIVRARGLSSRMAAPGRKGAGRRAKNGGFHGGPPAVEKGRTRSTTDSVRRSALSRKRAAAGRKGGLARVQKLGVEAVKRSCRKARSSRTPESFHNGWKCRKTQGSCGQNVPPTRNFGVADGRHLVRRLLQASEPFVSLEGRELVDACDRSLSKVRLGEQTANRLKVLMSLISRMLKLRTQ